MSGFERKVLRNKLKIQLGSNKIKEAFHEENDTLEQKIRKESRRTSDINEKIFKCPFLLKKRQIFFKNTFYPNFSNLHHSYKRMNNTIITMYQHNLSTGIFSTIP